MKFCKFIWKIISGSAMLFLLAGLCQAIIAWRPLIVSQEMKWWLAGGFLGGCAIFYRFPFIPLYVLGHELTHWGLGKLYGRQTSKFRIGRASGSVRVECPNIVIILGPYIFPFYLMIYLVCYALFLQLLPWYSNWFLPSWLEMGSVAAIGALYAYHLVLTFKALWQGQEDLKFNGWVYSMIFILLGNIFIIYIAIAFASHDYNGAVSHLWTVLKSEWNWLSAVCIQLYRISKSAIL